MHRRERNAVPDEAFCCASYHYPRRLVRALQIELSLIGRERIDGQLRARPRAEPRSLGRRDD